MTPSTAIQTPLDRPSEDDWEVFHAQYDDDAWECELCGGEGLREYDDAPDEWGEDCPSEMNHLIPCRGCAEVAWAKHAAMVLFLSKRRLAREGFEAAI